jgi:hypothetical protein
MRGLVPHQADETIALRDEQAVQRKLPSIISIRG